MTPEEEIDAFVLELAFQHDDPIAFAREQVSEAINKGDKAAAKDWLNIMTRLIQINWRPSSRM